MDDMDSGLGRLCARVDDDLSSWAAAGSSPRPFVEALRTATEARLLHVAIGSSYGSAVERGLAATDAEAALSLAACEAADLGQYEAKRLALRDHAASAAASLVGAMVRAALERDEVRLGIRGRSREADRRLVAGRPSRAAAGTGTTRRAGFAASRPSR